MSKRTFRPAEERARLVQEIDKLRAQGLEVKDAAQKVGTTADNYYNWRDQASVKAFLTKAKPRKAKVKRKYGARAVGKTTNPTIAGLITPETLPETRNDERVMVLIGPPRLVSEMMRSLQ